MSVRPPWPRHLPRCLECGFLSYQEPLSESGAASGVQNGEHYIVLQDPTPRCFLAAFDLAGETHALVNYPLRPNVDAGVSPAETFAAWELTRNNAEREAAEEVVARPRSCASFTPRRPGLGFEEHRELKLKQEDRRWTLVAATAGMVFGSALTLGAVALVLLLQR
jgi:hypothetical protein